MCSRSVISWYRRGGRARAAALVGIALVCAACGGGNTDSTVKRFAVSAAIDLGEEGSDVAVGEDAVWVTDRRSTVVRVDPKTNGIVARISVPSGAGSVAVGEGAVWTTGRSALARIDLSDNRVTGTVEVGAPQGLAVGEGAVWVANLAGNGTLSRVDPKTMRVVASIKVPPLPDDDLPLPQQPGQVAVGQGGVWVTDTRVGTVSRLDPKANRFTLTMSRVGPDSRGLAIGEGSIWVVGDFDVSRADPGRRLPDTLQIGDNPSPSDVAVGLGSVWISDMRNDTLTRVDPDTNRPTTAIQLPESPLGVAVGFGAVWVVGRGGLLSRVDER